MKKLIITIILLLCAGCVYADVNKSILADAIYRAEGGKKTIYPYGIRSVSCSGEKECRRICINTIRNNIRRYKEYGYKKYSDYLSFLASRYCPNTKRHPKQQQTWLKNVKAIYKQIGGKL